MLPWENLDKNGAIWCNLGVPKYAITKVKINHFKVNKSTTTKVNCHFPPEVNLDVHNTFKIYRGVWGGIPPEAEDFFKKIKQNGGFSFIFFLLFGRAP